MHFTIEWQSKVSLDFNTKCKNFTVIVENRQLPGRICLQKFEQLKMTNKEKEVKGENGNNIKHGVEL
jgi:hypothetical protein